MLCVISGLQEVLRIECSLAVVAPAACVEVALLVVVLLEAQANARLHNILHAWELVTLPTHTTQHWCVCETGGRHVSVCWLCPCCTSIFTHLHVHNVHMHVKMGL